MCTMHLRSVELETPDTTAAANFFREPWGLTDAGTSGGATYLRATAAHAYVVALRRAPQQRFAGATFSGARDEIESLYARLKAAGLPHLSPGPWVESHDEPGNGAGFTLRGTEGEPFRFIAEKSPAQALPVHTDRPLQLSHVVFNSRDREGASRTLIDMLGFKLSDRTRIMNFLRCDDAHHAIAYADAKQLSLNHIAFEMPSLESVMRGTGRLADAGYPTIWGPGRHGPGHNVFSYFTTPMGACVEYTAEVQRVDDSYRTGQPDDWKWPPGRSDHWGIATRDNARLAATGDAFPY
jgi:catechol 2,3-dioxygenase